MQIINLTQHHATDTQLASGVFEVDFDFSLLNFSEPPTKEIILTKAKQLAQIASSNNADAAMIGGAPYLMGPLVAELNNVGVTPVFAFSQRVSREERLPDGTVAKVSVFEHKCFIEGF